VLSLFLRRRDLSDDWAGAEQAAGCGDDRQFHEAVGSLNKSPLLFPWGRSIGGRRGPHTCPGSVLRDRLRAGHRRDTADIRRARELSKIPCRDDRLVTLGRCRLTGHGGRALTGKGIGVLVGNSAAMTELREARDDVLRRPTSSVPVRGLNLQ
jgi:hypothetical protein